ncbi:hypothetical protein LBMAG49_30400 [Planctomycetota bacterium]|nr:hypothetical protein LBMAG49_30400 [Planctomycetota bacterium]
MSEVPMAMLATTQNSPTAVSLPTVLHVGSGKNFRPEWLNLDVEPRWRPDFLYDLNHPLPASGLLPIATARFGNLELSGNTFDEIIAQDVLEHIRDLVTAMTTFLHWLKVGGVLKVAVPYELSLGAWCDPTHLRAFNERSFIYYSQWSWYLGWQTHNFNIRRMDLVPTELGKALTAAGRPSEEILRTPRAVEQIYVEMVKQPLDAQGLATVRHYLERPIR